MKKGGKFAQDYVKYIIKTPVLFYIFLLLGAALFIALGLIITIDNADGTVSLLYAIFVRAGKGT